MTMEMDMAMLSALDECIGLRGEEPWATLIGSRRAPSVLVAWLSLPGNRLVSLWWLMGSVSSHNINACHLEYNPWYPKRELTITVKVKRKGKKAFRFGKFALIELRLFKYDIKKTTNRPRHSSSRLPSILISPTFPWLSSSCWVSLTSHAAD